MKFVASRLSENNKIFPAEIHLENNGVTVKIPGLFSGRSEHIVFSKITNVTIETPIVGYSTITFKAAGTRVSAHGFTKAEVKQIKRAIDEKTLDRTANKHSNSKVIGTKQRPTRIECDYPKSLGNGTENNSIKSKVESEELSRQALKIELLERELLLEKERSKHEKSKQLELDEFMKNKRQFEDEKIKKINQIKHGLIEKYKLFGYFLIFWKFTLDKLWKKILFCYLTIVVLVSIYDYLSSFFL